MPWWSRFDENVCGWVIDAAQLHNVCGYKTEVNIIAATSDLRKCKFSCVSVITLYHCFWLLELNVNKYSIVSTTTTSPLEEQCHQQQFFHIVKTIRDISFIQVSSLEVVMTAIGESDGMVSNGELIYIFNSVCFFYFNHLISQQYFNLGRLICS